MEGYHAMETDTPATPEEVTATQPNCVTAFLVVQNSDGSTSAYPHDVGIELRPAYAPTLAHLESCSADLVATVSRQLLARSFSDALEAAMPTKQTTAEIMAAALASRGIG